MIIRDAVLKDASAIVDLLKQLEFEKSTGFIENRLTQTKDKSLYRNLVVEIDEKIVALMTIHFWIQIGLEGKTCTISFFVVDKDIRSQGIGKYMEEYCTKLAKGNGCSNVEVYSSEKRTDAHRFYERQGYKHMEKFFIKELE